MFLNYLKLSFRLLARNPFFAFIDIVGLAIGFTAFYALWEFSTRELQVDQYHKDAERIARIGVNWRWTEDGGKTWGLDVNGFTFNPSPALVRNFPEVESSVRLMNQPFFTTGIAGHDHQVLISPDDAGNQQRVFKEEKTAYADSNLFTFFTIPLIYGQPEKVLSEPNFVVLSHSTALKYFGKKDPTGQMLKLNDTILLKVSGVFEDLTHSTHLDFDLVISNQGRLNQWENLYTFAQWYVKIRPGSSFGQLNSNLNKKADEHFAAVYRAVPHAKLDFFVKPLKEVAFSKSFRGDFFYPKSKPFLLTLAFIAVSVLFMAMVNYVNLTVTRTTRRLKEVATRKVSGAGTADMAKQFMTEALVVNAMALVLSLTLIQLIRKPFSLLFNIDIEGLSSLSASSIVIFFGFIGSAILLSGLYPALIFIAHHPRALFNMSHPSSGKRIIPSLLTVGQFAAALLFIVFGYAVFLQLNHILKRDTGINKAEIVVIEAPIVKPKNISAYFELFGKQIAQTPGVSTVSASSAVVGDPLNSDGAIQRIGADLFYGMDNFSVDENFIPLYQIKMIAGRNFLSADPGIPIVISRYGARRLGFERPGDAVGEHLQIRYVKENHPEWVKAEVIGVFEDFRIASWLDQNERGTEYANQGRGIFLVQTSKFPQRMARKIGLKIEPDKIEGIMAGIEILFRKEFPGNAFTWYFLDDHVNLAYGNEKIARNQIILFTGLAIVIACVGLLGMISYKAIEKTKEIGIRKALGAKTIHISNLLLNSTLKQMMISIALGIPLAHYLIQQYFEKFADHVRLQWWHYALPVMILALIMLTTVASVLWKAARSNPVEALKYE